jgi:hypothetical protein
MAKITDPTLFSKYFGVEHDLFGKVGLIDPFTDTDTQLFIDPILLEKSSSPIIKRKALASFTKHFENFIRLLSISEKPFDAAWRAAWNLLDLSEPPETGLGYGKGRSGSSRPADVRAAIMHTSKEIIELGSKDPEMVSLMGFFEKDVGPDTISDFTTRAIMNELAEITEEFCEAHNIPLHDAIILQGRRLPRVVREGKISEMVLVPSDIVRDLPVANDWSEIENAAFENARLRNRVNAFLGNIARPTIAERKAALRHVALDSKESFAEFLAAVKEHASGYDPNIDIFGYYKLKSILAEGFPGLAKDQPYDLTRGPRELHKAVLDSIDIFKHHVEKGNLWEELWIGDKPKRERAAQLIYYAIADTFCRVNKIDVSPEANMGGGPVDFKFSKEPQARVLVEMKRSGGQVVHGYEKQLEIYKDAARTQYGIFVVMDFGDLGPKLNQIKEIQRRRLANGEPASDIIVVDATKKRSASKRR